MGFISFDFAILWQQQYYVCCQKSLFDLSLLYQSIGLIFSTFVFFFSSCIFVAMYPFTDFYSFLVLVDPRPLRFRPLCSWVLSWTCLFSMLGIRACECFFVGNLCTDNTYIISYMLLDMNVERKFMLGCNFLGAP